MLTIDWSGHPRPLLSRSRRLALRLRSNHNLCRRPHPFRLGNRCLRIFQLGRRLWTRDLNRSQQSQGSHASLGKLRTRREWVLRARYISRADDTFTMIVTKIRRNLTVITDFLTELKGID